MLTIAPLERGHLADARDLLAASCEYDPAAAVAEEKLFGPAPHATVTLGAFRGEALAGVAVVSDRWLRLLAVHPEARRRGVGSALLDGALAAARRGGAASLRTCDQPGNYLGPGIDERNEETVAFFLRRGFAPAAQNENLVVPLVDNQLVTPDRAAALAADARGYEVRRARSADLAPLLELAHGFSAEWAFEVARALENHPPTVHLAVEQATGQVVAFACIDGNNRGLGWFGPAGTAPAHRGRKLGQALLIPCLLDAAAAGHREATIAWIGPRAFYEGACDARRDRRFVVLAREARRVTRGMILAAGLGTRLGALSDERPKPLLPVVDIPLIRYAEALLRGHGVNELVVNLHHRGELIVAELGDAVVYSREPRILGTGGGIRHALPLLGDEPFFVVNGKIVVDVDLGDVLARHRAAGAQATLVVRPDPDARRWGAIDAPQDGGPIRSLLADGAFMFTGIQVLEPELVARLSDGEERCIVRQGYVPWLAAGVPIHAYVAPGYFMEHSTPERYLAGNVNVLRGRAALRFPPGPLSGIDATAEVEGTIVPPVRVGAGARIAAGAVVGPDAVVGAGATVAAGVRVARTVVWPGAAVTEDAEAAIVTPARRLVIPSALPPG